MKYKLERALSVNGDLVSYTLCFRSSAHGYIRAKSNGNIIARNLTIQRHKEENGYFVQNSPCVNNSSIFIPKNLRKYPT